VYVQSLLQEDIDISNFKRIVTMDRSKIIIRSQNEQLSLSVEKLLKFEKKYELFLSMPFSELEQNLNIRIY